MSAGPEVPVLAGLFSDGDAQPAGRRTIVVPAAGICEHALLEDLGITFERIRPLYGQEIGAPRDYHYGPRGPIFTITGVRRLVSHLQIESEVLEEGSAVHHYGPKHHRGRWYLEDQS